MKPYEFQAEDLVRMDWFDGRVLLAWDPGLGKTLEALWWLERKNAFPAIIVCPASVKWQWAVKTEELLGIKPVVLDGLIPNKTMVNEAKIIVVNYNILAEKQVKRNGTKSTFRGWGELLKKSKTRTIIIDEIQYVANQKTKCSRVVKSLCRRRDYVIGLSATPMLNRPIELFAGLQMIRPDIFRSRFEFAQKFCNLALTPWGWNYTGASNVEELHELLISVGMLRRKKTEVLDQFPSKVRNVVVLPLKDEACYNKARRSFLNWLEERDKDKARKARKAVTLTKVGYLLREAARLKMRYCIEWINQFLVESDEKMLVLAIHANAISALKRGCKCESVVIDGSTSSKARREAVSKFRNDNQVRLCIGNLRAAGVGVDGLQVTRNVAFAELPWQPGLVQQGEDRVWRIGSTKRVWAWYFVAKGTIEERLCRVLQEKQDTLTMILDGNKGAKDFDVLSKLLTEIRKENE